jgi:hypothetical protein
MTYALNSVEGFLVYKLHNMLNATTGYENISIRDVCKLVINPSMLWYHKVVSSRSHVKSYTHTAKELNINFY